MVIDINNGTLRFTGQMTEMRTRVASGGRIVIPAQYRRVLGLEAGDEVILRLEDGELRLFTSRRPIERAQELLSRYVSTDRSLAEELIAERRTEANRE